MPQNGKQKDLWTIIEELIDCICNFQTIPDFQSTITYTVIYKYLTEESAYIIESKTAPAQVRSLVNSDAIPGRELYDHIQFCLRDRLELIVQSAKDMLDEDILRLYEKHWSQYKAMCTQLDDCCTFVNRQWVRHEHNCGRRCVSEIATLSQNIWERVFIRPVLKNVIDACFNIIMSQHNHQTIDIPILKKITEIFVGPDFNETIAKMIDKNLTGLNLYQDVFEARLLRKADAYDRYQIISFNENESILTYLNRIIECANEEIDHVQSYLPELSDATEQSLFKIFEGAFIRHSRIVIDREIRILLDNNKHQDMVDLFKLTNQMPNTKAIFVTTMENYIQQKGVDAIKHVHTTAINDPIVYVDTLRASYTKYFKLVQETFNNDRELRAVFNKACHHFINNNSITESFGHTKKAAELLARYSDILLRKGGKIMDETESKEKSDLIMIVFNFIDDKDVYEQFYGKLLAKRLINELSNSADDEKLMITKLKEVCGGEYTSKLERMINDIDTSKTIEDEYRTYCNNQQQKLSVDFSIRILTTNSWSLSIPSNIIIPNELNTIYGNFIQYYNYRFNGRKLACLYQYSKGEIQTYFTQRKYILQVSMYQMIVLLLFNRSVQWTVEQIQNETQINIELLIQILNNLIKSKLLLCAQLNGEDLKENDFYLNCIVQLSDDFKNDKTRINLNIPMKPTNEKDTDKLHRTIDEDRKLIIQAAVVRTMKANKRLQYSLLLQKVIEQLSAGFKPNVSMIKCCIDILIEKEYLQRQSDEKDVLEYLA